MHSKVARVTSGWPAGRGRFATDTRTARCPTTTNRSVGRAPIQLESAHVRAPRIDRAIDRRDPVLQVTSVTSRPPPPRYVSGIRREERASSQWNRLCGRSRGRARPIYVSGVITYATDDDGIPRIPPIEETRARASLYKLRGLTWIIRRDIDNRES